MNKNHTTGWFKIRADLFSIPIGAKAISVYTYLAYLCHYNGHCVVRHKVIAEKTDMSVSSVKRALTALVEYNLIHITRRPNGANQYYLNWEPKSQAKYLSDHKAQKEQTPEEIVATQLKFKELQQRLLAAQNK